MNQLMKPIHLEWTGNSKHSKISPQEISTMLALLKELLIDIGCSGGFHIKATAVGLNGGRHLRGLSVAGFAPPNNIVLGYQPRGNDSRFKFNLFVPIESALKIHENLKRAAGKAYLGKIPNRLPPEPKDVPHISTVREPALITSEETFAAPPVTSGGAIDVRTSETLQPETVNQTLATKKGAPMKRQKNRYAEMFFAQKELPISFFSLMVGAPVSVPDLTQLITSQFSHWSPQGVGHLFGYLHQEEYLVRVKKMYALGPKGKQMIVDSEKSSESDSAASAQAVVVAEPAAVLLAESAPVPTDDTAAYEALLIKAQGFKQAAKAVTARVEMSEAALADALQTIAALQAQLPDLEQQITIRVEIRYQELLKRLGNEL